MNRLHLFAGCFVLTLVAAPASAGVVFRDNTPGAAVYSVAQTGEYDIRVLGGAADIEFGKYCCGSVYHGGTGSSGSADFHLSAGALLDVFVGSPDLGFGSDSTVSDAGETLMVAEGANGGSFPFYTAVDQFFSNSVSYDWGEYITFIDTTPPGSNGIGDGYYAVNGLFAPNGSVEIDAVPEPASWAMMLTGFGVAGCFVRKRRCTKVAFG